MALKLLLVCFVCVKVGSSQYYASSYPYPYNYPYPTSNYPVPQIPPAYPPNTYPVTTPTVYPTPSAYPTPSTYPTPTAYPTPTPTPQPSAYPQKGYYPHYGKNAPKAPTTTQIAYIVKSPEKYTVNSSEKQQNTEKLTHKCPTYNCPLCDGFKNVAPNSKISPPPKTCEKLTKTAPLLPENLLEKISNIEKGVKNEKKTLLSKLKDVCHCDKPKLKSIGDKLKEKCEKVKCYRFDEDLLDGFLTGLGLGD